MRAKWILGMMLLLSFCGSSGPADYNAFTAATRKLLCQHEIDCGFLDPSYRSLCELSFAASAPSVDTSRINYDSGAAGRCLDAAKNALKDCRSSFRAFDMMATDACKSVVSGKSPVGSPCPARIECVAGATCVLRFTNTSCSSSCEAVPAIGANCTGNCVDGAFCDGNSTTCQARLDVGAVCASSSQCKSTLVCVGTCHLPGGAGAACVGGLADCAIGLICDSTMLTARVCVPERQMGEACASSDDCAERLECIHSGPGNGRCLPPIPLGRTCITDGCQAPHTCIAGTCVAPVAIGDLCPNQNCITGYCNPTSGKCEPLVAAGGACDLSLGLQQCDGNGHCDPTSKTCQACP